jgi:hypothetical protein
MPTSPSFSVRPRPNYRRRRTIVLLVLLVIVVIVAALLSRSGGGGKDAATPQLAFVATANHVSQSKAPDDGTKRAQLDAIKTMFTTFYQDAFVDPEKWGEGTFEDLKKLFAEDAQASFTKDIQSLTIGQGRIDLERVEPRTANLAISVYYDGKSQPTFAVATATFVGRGTLKKTGPAVTINQKATFYLQKTGDDWTITAYDADQTQTTPTPSPTPTSS